MKKSRLFAPFLMLLAGTVASLMMFFSHYSMKEMLPILLAVLLLFYLAGSFIQKRVEAFVNQIKEEEEHEREIMELEAAMEGEGEPDGTFRENTENEAE